MSLVEGLHFSLVAVPEAVVIQWWGCREVAGGWDGGAKSDPRALARSALIDNQGPCDCSPTYLSCFEVGFFFFF